MAWSVRIVVVLYFVVIEYSLNVEADRNGSPNIAIVGSGIGGASTAYFLRDLFGNHLNIDVYEKSNIGGRLATVEIGGKHYESGGSIIHPKNAYMLNFTRLLGLEHQLLPDVRLGLYDGHEMVFDGSEWSLITLAQLMWRYGWNMVKLNNYIKDLSTKFDRIYDHQNNGLTFTNPERLLESLNDELMAYLHYSLEEVLAHEGFSQKIINELAMGVMRNNYGQTPSIHAFVGAVSLAGFEGGLWSVKGGNKQVPERLLKHLKINLIKSRVSKIVNTAVNGLVKHMVVSDVHTKMYDIVIIAAPLHDGIANVSFVGFDPPIKDFPEHYHQTVATFIRGLPHFTKFGYQTFHQFPDVILSTNESLIFNSFGKIHPIAEHAATFKDKQELPVWKLFSQRHLTDEDMRELFASYEEVKIVDWKAAYPHYSSGQVNLPSFKLSDQLYYVNAIELAASAMEMMAVGARNVALLAYNEWHDKNDLVNPYVHGQFGKQEL